MTDLYPLNAEDDKKIQIFINPETGEILDMDLFQKSMADIPFTDSLKKTVINNVRRESVIQGAIKQEIDNLKRLLDVSKSREGSKLKFLKYMIEIDGPIDLVTVKAKLQKNPPKVVIDDETKLKEYIKVELKEIKSLDKKGIATDLKAGKDVDGATLIQGTRVVIS